MYLLQQRHAQNMLFDNIWSNMMREYRAGSFPSLYSVCFKNQHLNSRLLPIIKYWVITPVWNAWLPQSQNRYLFCLLILTEKSPTSIGHPLMLERLPGLHLCDQVAHQWTCGVRIKTCSRCGLLLSRGRGWEVSE